MTKYIVKRPWYGVSKGDVIETDKLHPALLPNVEAVDDRHFEVATPSQGQKETDPEKMNLPDLKFWLTEQGIDFDATAKKAELQGLIPVTDDGDGGEGGGAQSE